jgi:hypothetical protein
MPRQSIVPSAKDIISFNVNITQTTEEQIWENLKNKLAEIHILFEEARTRQNEMVNLVFSSNPYENCNWRNKQPKRIEFLEWTRGENKWYDFMRSIFEIKHDIKLCLDVFSWWETKPEEASELEYEMIKLDLDYQREFENYEKMRYMEAKKNWEIRDAVWIAEKKARDNHNLNHKSEEGWKSVEKRIKEGYWTYDDPLEVIIKNTRDPMCKYCIEQNKFDKECEEKQRILEEHHRISEEEWKLQKEVERKRQIEERELYKCKCCEFETYDENAWDKHEDSKQHKKLLELKKIFCESCEVQCRNQTEFSIHIQTKKHKIATGKIQKQVDFKCEGCDYITQLKQNFEKHLLTKSHIEKHKLL